MAGGRGLVLRDIESLRSEIPNSSREEEEEEEERELSWEFLVVCVRVCGLGDQHPMPALSHTALFLIGERAQFCLYSAEHSPINCDKAGVSSYCFYTADEKTEAAREKEKETKPPFLFFPLLLEALLVELDAYTFRVSAPLEMALSCTVDRSFLFFFSL